MSKTWSQYVTEAEQHKFYKQRCEQLEAALAEIRRCIQVSDATSGEPLKVLTAIDQIAALAADHVCPQCDGLGIPPGTAPGWCPSCEGSGLASGGDR